MDPFLDEEQQEGGGFDPAELLRAFWRRKLLFFIPFVLCLAMAGIAIRTMTPIYASSGQIMIQLNEATGDLLENPRNRFGGRYGDLNRIAYQEMDLILTSPEFLEKIVMELELHRAIQASQPPGEPPLSDEQAVRRARNKLRSMVRLKSDGDRLFRLEVRDPDPARAHSFAGVILERFVSEYRASQMASNTESRDFYERQLEIHLESLRAAENELTDFQAGLASAALADNPVNAMNLGTAESNLTALRSRYNGADAEELSRLGQTARQVLGSLPALEPYRRDPSVATVLSELSGAELQYLLEPIGSGALRDLEVRLGQIRVRLRSLLDSMVAQRTPNLGLMDRNRISQFLYFSLYRATVGDVIATLDGHMREFRDFTARQPGQSAQLAELQSAVTRARGLVESIESEITQHNMNLAASLSEVGIRIRIREVPEPSWGPVEPNKMKLMAMGVILSVGIGIGLVVLAIMLDRSFRTVESIERTLGVPVIGTLPMIQDDHFERKRKIRYLRWVTIVLGVIAVAAVGFLVVYPRLG